MHLSDNEADARQADRLNRVTEYTRRKRNNTLLNVAALAVMVYVAVVELIKHWGL